MVTRSKLGSNIHSLSITHIFIKPIDIGGTGPEDNQKQKEKFINCRSMDLC
jgi:hypothetical protein